MGSNSKIKLNIFEINEDYINKLKSQSFVHIYELLPIENITIEERDQKIIENLTMGIVVKNDNKLYVYSFIELDIGDIEKKIRNKIGKRIGLNYIDTINFKNLTNIDALKSNLLLKKILKHDLREKINKIINDLEIVKKILERYKSVESFFSFYQTIRWNSIRILKINDNKLYASFDIKSRILIKKNLWDFVGKDINTLKKLEDLSESIYFLYIPRYLRRESEISQLKKVYTKKEYEEKIRKNIGLSYQELLEYPSKKYGIKIEEIACPYNSQNVLDEEQPIIECRNGSFYPVQFCLPIYTPNLLKIFDRKEEKENITILRNIIREISKNKYKIFEEIIDRIGGILKKQYYDEVIEIENTNSIKIEVERRFKNSNNRCEINSTSHIAKFLREKDLVPIYIPDSLKRVRTINIRFLVYDELLKENSIKDCIEKMIKDIEIRVVRVFEAIVNNGINEKQKIKIEVEKEIIPISKLKKEIDKIKEIRVNSEVFVFMVGTERVIGTRKDYYENVKRTLIENGIIASQNILIERYRKLKDDPNKLSFMMNNILYDMFSKFGIRLFSVNMSSDYDYIIGIDVGRNYILRTDVIGCITVFSKDSANFKILPISIPTKQYSEKILYGEVFRKLKSYCNIEGKKVLILKDGNIHNEELEDLKNISIEYKVEISLIGVKKSNPVIDLGNSKKMFYVDYLRENSEKGYLVKFHFTRNYLPTRLIEITQLIEIKNGKFNKRDLEKKDFLTLYSLCILNLSSLSESPLKLPSPIYYADKFVKVLGKGWDVRDEEKLKYGMLYFI